MTRSPKIYRKLAGSGFSAALKHSLWQGPDHLLWVESVIFQEHYRRFYFQDIETLVLQRTGRRTLWTLVLGAFLSLFGALAVFSESINYLCIFMASLFAILMVVQWLMGPGCRVHLQTAVQKYTLSNLLRMRKAMKVMDRIRTLTEAAQGPLGDTDSVRIHDSGIPNQPVSRANEKADGNRFEDAGTETAGSFPLRLHGVLYGLLFFFGLARGAQLWLKSVPLAVADMAVLLLTMVLAIIVLARMRSRGKASLLALSAWLSLVFSVIHAMAAYGIFIAASIRAMRSMRPAYNNWALIKNFFLLQVDKQPAIEAIAAGAAFASIALGILGLVAVLTVRRNRRKPPLRKSQ